THHFKDSAHRTAGNNTGTILGWQHQNRRCAMFSGYRVLQRTVLQGDLDHLATSFFHCLLHGDRHFFRLAFTHADATIAVTDHSQCCETHDTTTLDHFGHTVDRDHFFAHAIIRLIALHFRLHFCHDDSSL